ncbi:hypothetical protein Ahy_B01g051933 [Arachis hypogaea]|uniref:PB1-like domain-containing protein n=1 Tax=Arachis hypogaea TaxID=3818 RepID=A0A445AN42_ARAHY|nr:hypothetical protein Ahy_B01g051933 [Arachis hypogaea]
MQEGNTKTVMGDFVFTVDHHHGGQMVSRKGGKEYLGGMVVEGLQFELDEWSLQEIVAALKEIRYTANAKILWNEPGVALKDGLRELKSDGDAMKIGKFVVEQETKHCHVYAVNGCRQENGVEIPSNNEDYIPSDDNRFDDNADDGDHDDHFGFNVEEENQQGQHPNAFGGNSGSLGIDDNNIDVGVGVENNTGGVSEDGAEIDVGDISSGYDTESLDSYDGDSDEPVRRKRYPRYNEADMSVDYEFWLGTEFNSIAEFTEAIKEQALLNGRDIRYQERSEVLRANPGSTLKLKLDRPYPTIQPRDPNDNYFSLVVAAVEAETKDSWVWFLELLLQDIGDFTNKKWVFMGCFKYFMKCFREWSIGFAFDTPICQLKMDCLKEVNRECYDKLAALDPKHACSAIFMKGDNLEDYYSNYYTAAAYLACYGTTLNPINGENIWPKVELDTIRPLIFRVKPERPKRVRIREHDEDRSQTKLRRSGTSVTCSNCGQYEHNRRHCPNPDITGNNPGSESVAPQGSAPAPAPHGSAPVPTPAETSTAPFATVSQRERGRGRGRGRGGSRSGKARSATHAVAVSQPAPAPPASAITSSTIPPLPPLLPTPAPPLTAPAPRSFTAPLLPLPATPPLPALAPTRSTAPHCLRQKNFGVRRSGRLKIGVRKAKARPSETINLTAD